MMRHVHMLAHTPANFSGGYHPSKETMAGLTSITVASGTGEPDQDGGVSNMARRRVRSPAKPPR